MTPEASADMPALLNGPLGPVAPEREAHRHLSPIKDEPVPRDV